MGGVARTRDLANRIKADLAIIDKRRAAANESEVMNIIGDVKGKICIVPDDIIDTAGFEDVSNLSIEGMMHDQSKIALEECNIIFFVSCLVPGW